MNSTSNGNHTGARYLEVATPDCVADDFGGEIVVLNLVSGLYFSLRGLSAAIWRDLARGNSDGDLLAGLAAADTAVAATAADLLQRLEASGLLRPTAPFGAPGELESAALVRAGDTDLAFESYEDMKDLVLADPIHDSDENFGWPVRRPEA